MLLAHADELTQAAPGGLIHLLTQWDHLIMIVLAVILVGALLATLRGSQDQAD